MGDIKAMFERAKEGLREWTKRVDETIELARRNEERIDETREGVEGNAHAIYEVKQRVSALEDAPTPEDSIDVHRAEYKDLARRVAVLERDKKRIDDNYMYLLDERIRPVEKTIEGECFHNRWHDTEERLARTEQRVKELGCSEDVHWDKLVELSRHRHHIHSEQGGTMEPIYPTLEEDSEMGKVNEPFVETGEEMLNRGDDNDRAMPKRLPRRDTSRGPIETDPIYKAGFEAGYEKAIQFSNKHVEGPEEEGTDSLTIKSNNPSSDKISCPVCPACGNTPVFMQNGVRLCWRCYDEDKEWVPMTVPTSMAKPPEEPQEEGLRW